MKNRNHIFTTVLLTLAFFAVRPGPDAFGVVPPPDGGYPNFTTAEGLNALKNLTTGSANTALGWYSLFSDTTASFNTGVGAGTLVLNTGDENTAIGTAALLLNTASGNTAVGSRALLNNTTGGTLGNTQGIDVGPNVAVGAQALESNTIASANTAVGYQALGSFTVGIAGSDVGLCTAVGFQALANATGGFRNSGFGYQALMNNTDGLDNTAIGLQALFNNTTGNNNVASGNNALLHNTDGGDNTANGFGALAANTHGSDNTASGIGALVNNSSGSGNTALGAFAGQGITTANNVICIGTVGQNTSDSCYIGNISGQTSPSGIPVLIDANGKLGTMLSSKRFKDEIKPMDKASEALFSLRPVTFHYKKELDPAGVEQFGLVAEDVEKVNANLVVRDKNGEIYTVRYDAVNVMLLNEFVKEHRKVEELAAAVAELAATVKEQATELRKVSGQANHSAAELVLNLR